MKLDEARSNLLEVNIVNDKVDLVEIQSTDVKEVLRAKLSSAQAHVSAKYGPDAWTMVEDQGLFFENMNGTFPGALIKFYFRSLGTGGLVRFNGGSRAIAVSAIGLAIGKQRFIRVGTLGCTVASTLPEGARDSKSYDPVIFPDLPPDHPNAGSSFATLLVNVKYQITHASKAYQKIRKVLLSA